MNNINRFTWLGLLALALLCLFTPRAHAQAGDFLAQQTASNPLQLRIADGSIGGGVLGTFQFKSTNVLLTASATNYVFLDLTTNPPTLTVNQTGFPTTACYKIATAVTSASQITSLTDSRPSFNSTIGAGGGISSVSSLPATCTPGVTQPVNLTINGVGYGEFYCGGFTTGGGTTNTWLPSNPLQTISPLAYGAKADTQMCFGTDVSWTTANPSTVTVSANCPFKPGDTGKIAFGTNGNGGALASFAGTVTLPQGTLTYVSPTTATVNTSGTACNTSACIFVWGSDDSTALANAWAAVIALANCGTLSLPQGAMLTQQAQFITHDPEGCSPGGTGSLGNIYGASFTVHGQGVASSIIVPTPNFAFAGCTGNGDGCFGGNRLQFIDWSIFGAGNGATSAGSAKAIVDGANETYLERFSIVSWGGNDANLTGLICVNTCLIDAVKVMGAGSIGFSGGGNVTNSVFDYSKTRAINVSPAGSVLSTANTYIGKNNTSTISVLVTGNGSQWNSVNDNITTFSAASHAVQVNGVGASAYFTNSTLVGNTTGSAIWVTGNGATAHARGSILTGGASGTAVRQDTGGIFFDEGGNTFTNGYNLAASTGFVGEGSTSFNQTTVTAAKLVLSAGWGSTAANTALTGGNAPIQFTITNSGTGQGASPTITYTFPTPYAVAPFSCTATQTGGTNATGTFTSSALSATGVTFTFSLTPTAASTEIVQVTCVTP